MNRYTAERKLAKLGFEIDWSCTGKAEGYWSGTIDALGRGMIDGDCRGEVVHGDNAADFYRNAVAAADGYAKFGPNRLCTDPDCEFHSELPAGADAMHAAELPASRKPGRSADAADETQDNGVTGRRDGH